jgi:hypothetical protein
MGVLDRLTFATPDRIIPFTIAAALICAPLVWWVLYNWTGLDPVRSLMIAVSVPIGAVGAFEIPFQVIRGLVYPSPVVATLGFQPALALASWVVVGLTGIGFWKVTRLYGFLLALTAAGFLIGWALGYPQVTSVVTDQIDLAYVFNVPLKFALPLLLLFPLPIVERARGILLVRRSQPLRESGPTADSEATRGVPQ